MTDIATSLRLPGVFAGVREYRRLTYRALALQTVQTMLPPVWQALDDDGTDLVVFAATCGCAGPARRRCCQRYLCLAAAVWLDTPDEWVAGIPRAARVEYFAELERVAAVVDPWISSQDSQETRS